MKKPQLLALTLLVTGAVSAPASESKEPADYVLL